MLGSSSARMLAIGVRYADTWNSYFRSTDNSPAGVVPLRDRVDAACIAAGRDPGTMARSVAVLVDVRGDSPISDHFRAGVQPLTGSAEEIAAGLRAYADVGVSHLQLFTVPMLMQGVDALAPILEAFDSMERG
jgi:alkanesulfonate monooxygenase SsuD/methylene tetrahydromethanopterin reductase-like flavin-dependent oxidoreductase (luciferase family)